MRLTTFTDYSLRVLIFLAAQPDGRATIAEVAKAFDISENHLTKVVHFLGKAGFLANLRGRGGGLRLAMAPDAINIGEVVRQCEGVAMPAECFDRERNHCTISRVCGLRRVLADAVQAFYAVLDDYTLADVLGNRDALGKVLFAPNRQAALRQ
jgi:Rrf2 family nitric oxide-sensitive transcriptional repressor